MKISQRKAFTLAIVLGAFALIGGTGLTVSSAWLITMASQHPPVLVLSVAIVMVRFFGIFRSAARYGERVISHEAIFRKLTGIRVELFSAIASRLRTRSVDVARSSKTMVDDVERAQEFALRVTLPGISAAISGIFTLLLALWIEPLVFLLIAPAILIFTTIIPYLVRALLDPIANEIEEQENGFAEDLASASHAMVEAEVFGVGGMYRLELKSATELLRALERKSFLRTSLLQFLTLFTIGSTLTLISLSLKDQSEVLPITVSMAVFLALVGFEGYTTWFPNLFPAGKSRRASESVVDLAKNPIPEIPEGERPISTEIQGRLLVPYWDEKFLAPINFSALPGEVLVVSGASGIGKSTFASSILGFAPYQGSLTIGGVEVREIGELSRYVSGTLQHGYVFNTTLRENLKIADGELKDIQLLEMLEALELSSIGLDEILGEFGRALSGGEAKRLSIARALLSSAPIVILDEPLEHLDYERGLRIQAQIMKRAIDRTLIVITHSPWLQYSRKLELARE